MLNTRSAFLKFLETENFPPQKGKFRKMAFALTTLGVLSAECEALFCLPQQKRDVYLLNPPSVPRAQAYQFSVRSMAKALPSPPPPYMVLRAISSPLLERKGHHFAWCMGFKIWGRRISCLFKYEMVPGFNLHRVTATNVCC